MAPAFDPFNQVLTIINKNGEPLPLPMPYLDLYIHYGCRMCINYGVQLGATIMVLILVLILTNPERRKSPVFALNVAALGFNMARAVCRVLFFVSPWNEVYAIFTFDYSRVSKGDYAASLLAVIFSVLVILCIEISLVFQIQVLCATLRRLYRYPLIGISYCVAIGMLISRIWLAAEDCKRILHNAPGYATAELQKVNSILLTVINVWFCAVFAGKLGFAMHLRRRLGIKKLGPMKVLFIMGCQTMIVPGTVLRSRRKKNKIKHMLTHHPNYNSYLCNSPIRRQCTRLCCELHNAYHYLPSPLRPLGRIHP